MKLFQIIVVLILTVFSSCTQEEKNLKDKKTETTTYYFIRHAEKDRSDSSNNNPNLTEVGKARAENWSKILQHVKFDVVYSTDYYRTKETAMPTASKNSLELTLYNPNQIESLSFIQKNKGKNVLIVGHSNTTPEFVNEILGYKKYEWIDDNNNGNLYIVTIIDGKMTDQILTIN